MSEYEWEYDEEERNTSKLGNSLISHVRHCDNCRHWSQLWQGCSLLAKNQKKPVKSSPDSSCDNWEHF